MKLSKTTISKTKYFLLALLVAFSFSCSPEDGEDGQQGQEGPAGQDGNANVIESDWFQIEFDETNPSDDYGSMKISNNDIDNYITNGGVLLMYIKVEEAGEFIIYPLPYGEEFTFVVADIPSQNIENALVFIIDSSTVSDYENTSLYTIKYVIIPPASTSARTGLDYSKMSYYDVMNHLGLKE